MPAANGAITIVSDGTSYQIRPAPLVSISQSVNNNKIGRLSPQYNITLTGFFVTKNSSIADSTSSSSTPNITGDELVYQLNAQNRLRNILNGKNLELQISDVDGNAPIITCKPRVESIDFEEGVYVDISRYTVTLVANALYGSNITQPELGIIGYANVSGISGVAEFTDTWSFEVDESYGRSDSNNDLRPRSYIVTRNVSAVGNDPSGVSDSSEPSWKLAHIFASSIISDEASKGMIGSGLLGFDETNYYGYNHSRVSTIDKTAGSVSITDTWYVASGLSNALETYNLSVSTSADNPYVRVSIDGTVKGLVRYDAWSASGYLGGNLVDRPYNKAHAHFMGISNNGNYGINSKIYKRANNAITETLNSVPLTVSLGLNEVAGEITYNLEFDNRPSNYFEDAIYESISVNDTYPGDVFATIPVLGRPTGPILQYTFGRTEFRRDMSVEILLDSTDIGYNLSSTGRGGLLLTKPSLSGSTRTKLNTLITELSPASEPGVRKYFLAPPQESWNPKEGRYTLSLSWTYELSE